MNCPRCHSQMIRTWNDVRATYRWDCTKKGCKLGCQEHPDGSMMSSPGGRMSKVLRVICHNECAKIWGDFKDQGCDRDGMYRWLNQNTHYGHIGKMGQRELNLLLGKLKEERKRREGAICQKQLIQKQEKS